MDSDDESPLFAFHDLDYIPYGVGGSTAPYIETPASTMRAAAALMRLGLIPDGAEVASTHPEPATTVVCDLGCGDGDFLIGLLAHIKTLTRRAAAGVGIDYDAELIKSARGKAELEGLDARWLVYDFNEDRENLVGRLVGTHGVTHVFVYLVPKQLALQTVRRILTRLCKSGVVVCCYKFHPKYLTPARRDEVMELVVFDETS